MKVFRRLPNIVIGIVFVLILTFSGGIQAKAAQQQWGAAYLDQSGALLSQNSTISQVIQPLEISPNTYWEAGWHWDNVPDGGYGGIQSCKDRDMPKSITCSKLVNNVAFIENFNGTSADNI